MRNAVTPVRRPAWMAAEMRTSVVACAVAILVAAHVARADDLLVSGRRLELVTRSKATTLDLVASGDGLTLGRGP
jgi:hypothetical protein